MRVRSPADTFGGFPERGLIAVVENIKNMNSNEGAYLTRADAVREFGPYHRDQNVMCARGQRWFDPLRRRFDLEERKGFRLRRHRKTQRNQ